MRKDLALPGQTSLFPAESRGAVTPADWRTIKARGKRIVAMMLAEGGWWTLTEIRERCGGSDTGNSASLRAARKYGYLLHTDRRGPEGHGVFVYRIELAP